MSRNIKAKSKDDKAAASSPLASSSASSSPAPVSLPSSPRHGLMDLSDIPMLLPSLSKRLSSASSSAPSLKPNLRAKKTGDQVSSKGAIALLLPPPIAKAVSREESAENGRALLQAVLSRNSSSSPGRWAAADSASAGSSDIYANEFDYYDGYDDYDGFDDGIFGG